MDTVQIVGAFAHSKTSGFRNRLKRASNTIEHAYQLCKNPFVSWSIGKDSNAMLWLVLQKHPDAIVRVLTVGETRHLYPMIDDHFQWWINKFPEMDFAEINVDHVYGDGWETAEFWEQNKSLSTRYTKYFHSFGNWDGVFIGYRAEESRDRRLWLGNRLPDCPYAIRQYSPNRKDSKAGVYRIAPLDKWTTNDVMAVNVMNNIPLLPEYQTDGFESRTALRISKRTLEHGQLAKLRQRDPAQWNMLIARFPELAEES